ncbi:hypothetical protein L9F63_017846, partial [Diploptera punctata]
CYEAMIRIWEGVELRNMTVDKNPCQIDYATRMRVNSFMFISPCQKDQKYVIPLTMDQKLTNNDTFVYELKFRVGLNGRDKKLTVNAVKWRGWSRDRSPSHYVTEVCGVYYVKISLEYEV